MEQKKCRLCDKEKDITAFRSEKKVNNTFIRSACKACERKVSAPGSKKRRSNYIEKERAAARRYTEKYPRKYMLKAAKNRASKYNIPFSITVDDIIIPSHCPILGIKLERTKGTAGDCSPSLDKLNPELGYVPGNVKVISRLANIMKAHASKEQLATFVKNVIPYINGQQ